MDGERIALASSLSLLTDDRKASIADCLRATAGIGGDTAEIGIASSGTTQLIAMANNGKRHWACDTFAGLVDSGAHDGTLTNGMFHNVDAEVRERLRGFGNVEVIAGYFPESAPPAMRAVRYSFVHIDVDTYQSIRNCFTFFAGRMAPGGLIALDDVLPEGSGCPGAQKAWLEIVKAGGPWRVVWQTPPQVVVQF